MHVCSLTWMFLTLTLDLRLAQTKAVPAPFPVQVNWLNVSSKRCYWWIKQLSHRADYVSGRWTLWSDVLVFPRQTIRAPSASASTWDLQQLSPQSLLGIKPSFTDHISSICQAADLPSTTSENLSVSSTLLLVRALVVSRHDYWQEHHHVQLNLCRWSEMQKHVLFLMLNHFT